VQYIRDAGQGNGNFEGEEGRAESRWRESRDAASSNIFNKKTTIHRARRINISNLINLETAVSKC
jgi:hypothetical protein